MDGPPRIVMTRIIMFTFLASDVGSRPIGSPFPRLTISCRNALPPLSTITVILKGLFSTHDTKFYGVSVMTIATYTQFLYNRLFIGFKRLTLFSTAQIMIKIFGKIAVQTPTLPRFLI